MNEFKNKSKISKILYSIPFVIFILILVIISLKATWNVWKKQNDSKTKLERSQAELQKILSREYFLKSEIAKLQTDTGVEEEIRSKYSAVKQGEKMIIIVDKESTTTKDNKSEVSWWAKFLEIFK